MHTNAAMLRRFSWASNSLWPEDLNENDIPATIVLTENDEIVPTAAVEELFRTFNSRKTKKSEKAQTSVVTTFKDASHGEMFMVESLRATTANMIIDMIESSRKNSVLMDVDPISQFKKEYRALIDVTAGGEFWDRIIYMLPTRTAGEQPTTPFQKIKP